MSNEVRDPLLPDRNFISSLQSLADSLQNRVKELEEENAKLSSRLSSCCCRKIEEACDRVVVDCNGLLAERKESKTGGNGTAKKKVVEKISGSNTRTINHHCKRYVALKIMYFGKRFYGFASEAQMDPTIESEIFSAFEKTRLLVGDKKELQYSRCGRTDKGVSSVGQVIALLLRSSLKETDASNENSEEIVFKEQHEQEIDYVGVLNRVLPDDIRVLGWCPVPVGFSARFSCLSREYKYFFWRENLNFLAMEEAGKKFLGEHDFRNFCKMDAVNVHNYKRNITLFEICPSDVIDTLLDTEKTPRKPQYTMAPELPLVLHSCEFESIKFICSADAGLALRMHLANQCRNYQLQAAIFNDALLSCLPISSGQRSLKGTTKKKASHVPLMSRPTEPSYEERRLKLNSKTFGLSKSS
ncbi:tRNA pseudouridine(38/39) synthase isoform X4 [Carya illinoinensis]|uniref:tRNA pseudouridine(38/39) synthase isoform X4 n=1 Tax=Carya illinoinensis TaxID=32201 RepID=UPI001C728701|nr:tRNA pseudouridine(38/39) synthase isoform X4 [Carya illinoinensis]